MNLNRANTNITEYLAKVQKHLRKVQSLYITEFRVCSAHVQFLINCIFFVAESSSIYTTRKESLQKEPLKLIIFCLQAVCLDAVWLYPKLRKSFRYFDYCRVDFPYSANKTEDPRSQDRTDKKQR